MYCRLHVLLDPTYLHALLGLSRLTESDHNNTVGLLVEDPNDLDFTKFRGLFGDIITDVFFSLRIFLLCC